MSTCAPAIGARLCASITMPPGGDGDEDANWKSNSASGAGFTHL
ncbi:MAG TPA: hypothetical protein VEL79_18145 [Vicinamibacterales bacterium]|nr:hypothetical protein [Vicinamibacterales bacterium]